MHVSDLHVLISSKWLKDPKEGSNYTNLYKCMFKFARPYLNGYKGSEKKDQATIVLVGQICTNIT